MGRTSSKTKVLQTARYDLDKTLNWSGHEIVIIHENNQRQLLMLITSLQILFPSETILNGP